MATLIASRKIPGTSGIPLEARTLYLNQFSGTPNQRYSQALGMVRNGSYNRIVISEDILISSVLLLISNLEVVIRNCRVKLAAGARDNIFRAETSGLTNVRLIGEGAAVLEGCDDDWGSDTPAGVDGSQWKSIGLLLYGARNFYLSGLTMRNTNSWAIGLEQCAYGKVENIYFDQSGNHKNQDGLDIRRGTHDIFVRNLSGICQDDMVALTNITSYTYVNVLSQNVMPENPSLAIYNIHVSGLNRQPSNQFPGTYPHIQHGSGVLLLPGGGLQIHDVCIEGVTGYQQICVGFTGIDYGSTNTVDMYNIKITNTDQAPVYTYAKIRDSYFENIPEMDSNNRDNSLSFVSGSYNVEYKFRDKPRMWIDGTGTLISYATNATGSTSTPAQTPTPAQSNTQAPANYTEAVAPGYAPAGDNRIFSVLTDDYAKLSYLPSDERWMRDTNLKYASGQIHYRTLSGGRVTFKYFGGSFQVNANTNSDFSDVEVYDKGTYITTFSYYTATDQNSRIIATINLPVTDHEIELRAITVDGRVKMVQDDIVLVPAS